jgi:L-ascorbate metabolism protein UlaG (beta-lactamase superfamily)
MGDMRRFWLAGCALVSLSFASPVRAEVELRWLGVAGFTLRAGDTVIAHDPYLSRPGFFATLLRRYEPDAAVLERLLAAPGPAPELARASLYLVGHSHYDHLGDVPWLALRTNGRVLGSATTAAIAQGYGVPEERTVVVGPGNYLEEGAFTVRAIASEHAKVFFGSVPFEGEVLDPPEAPLHAFSFKMGGALGYLVTERASGLRVMLLSSANRNLVELEAEGMTAAPVDALLAASSGRDADYARDLVRTLRPRLVVPHHFDDFSIPLGDPDAGAALDEEDLAAFEAELRAAAAAEGVALEIRRPGLFEVIAVRSGGT